MFKHNDQCTPNNYLMIKIMDEISLIVYKCKVKMYSYLVSIEF